MLNAWLSRNELIDLTGKKRPSAQRRALNRLGIDSRERPDGTLVVWRSALDRSPRAPSAAPEPNLDALSDVA